MKKRKWNECICAFFKRHINGTKGAISILLAIAVSPLLSIALLLVESARYQSAVEQIKEITNSSAFSTLSDYDSYLEERFGLFAIDQKENVDANFAEYMDYNADLIGKGLTLSDTTATGKFPLSNSNTLKQQVKEFGEITVTAEVLTEGLDIDKMIEKLREMLKLDDLTKEIEKVQAGVDVATEVEKLVESLATLKSDYDAYTKALEKYKSAYTTFEEEALDLVEELKDAEGKLQEGESHDTIYEKYGVKNAIKAAKKAANTYKDKTTTLKEKLSTLNTNVNNLMSAAQALPEKLQNVKDKTSSSKFGTTSTYEWIIAGVGQINTSINTVRDKDTVTNEIEALGKQITKLGKLGDKTITSSWTAEKIKSEYGTETLKGVSSRFVTTLDNLESKLNQKAQVEDDQSMSMGDLVTLAQEMLKLQLIFDPSLNSKINPNVLYTNDVGMSLSDKSLITSINLLVSACDDFQSSIKSLNFLKAIKAVVKLLGSIVTFLGAIVTWAGTLINVINNSFDDLLGNFIMFGYGAYNMPNRVICTKGKALTGYSYSKLFTKAGGSLDKYGSIGGTLADLANQNDGTGKDTMFKGAVAEYLLVGANSETLNQSCTFLKIYLLRLVLDIFHVMNSEWVQATSAAAGPGSFLVTFCFVIVEPFIDALLLVNGVNQCIWKDQSYFSFKGFVYLQNDLVDMFSNGILSGNIEKILKKQIENKNGKPERKGLFSASYTEHLLLLMLTVDSDAYMNRLKNVIQMEGKSQDSAFKLSKTYTYLYTDVSYKLNPMFNLEGLTDGSAFTGKTTQYAGY